MTDPTAGAPGEVPTESATDAPAPDTTPAESTPTEPAPEAPATGTASPEAVFNRTIAGIDSTVEQGNRVALVDPITRTNPLEGIVAKIDNHFVNGTNVVADLRALANELETLLGSLRAGL